MPKSLRWHVWCGDTHAAFNDYGRAMRYAQRLSAEQADTLSEVITRGPQAAMYGQYCNGRTTPGFASHHKASRV